MFDMTEPDLPWWRLTMRNPSAVASGRVRLQTLVVLRWLAIAGQLMAVLMVNMAFGYPLPLGFCLAAIAASAWLNIILTVRYSASVRIPDWQAALYFAFDILQLAILLYLTGGLENPFALLFMAPVTISATALSLRSTIVLLLLTFGLVTALAVFHEPLPWHENEPLSLPRIYLVGIWAALSLGIGFMAAYAWRVANEAKRMSNALSATQLVLARAQRLTALDGLAAAAAHELGTPLGTIALVSKELLRGGLTPEQTREDLKLLNSQAERCKEILSRLARQPDENDAVYSRLPLSVLLDEVTRPYQDGDIEFNIDIRAADEDAFEPQIRRRPEMMFGLGNLVENAADFARAEVSLHAHYTKKRIRIEIMDDGPGFPPDVLDRLGEPYVTTRPRKSARAGQDDDEDAHEGMGLGVFIAKTLLERTGARVDIGNRNDSRTGALIQVEWARDAVEADNMYP